MSLRELALSDTRFSGNLPESIGNLMELRTIAISGCLFSGQIPNSLANLSQLVIVDLSDNNFSGPIPSFQGWKKLTDISLSGNALTGVVLSTHFEGLLDLSCIDLSYNSLNGSIPLSLFSLPSLQEISLSNNKFSGQMTGFSNESLSPLDTLDLSSNKLQGPIPSYFFAFQSLASLSLSFNNFSGTIQLESFQRLQNIFLLDLSYNSLIVNVSVTNSSLSSFPQLAELGLASCKLQKFPPLMNQSGLDELDLSNNQISGLIPNWIWNISGGFPYTLNLSCNLLVGFQPEFTLPRFDILDLHSNQLQGEIPILPEIAIYVDYSRNNFSSSIPAEIGKSIASAFFFSLADNMLSGPIPPSICNGSRLEVLDLSNNGFSGTIPPCLIDSGSKTLGVLNLHNNSLADINPNFMLDDMRDVNVGNWEWESGTFPESGVTIDDTDMIQGLGSNLFEDDSDSDANYDHFSDSDYGFTDEDDRLYDENVDVNTTLPSNFLERDDRMFDSDSEEYPDSDDGFSSLNETEDEDDSRTKKTHVFKPIKGKEEPVFCEVGQALAFLLEGQVSNPGSLVRMLFFWSLTFIPITSAVKSQYHQYMNIMWTTRERKDYAERAPFIASSKEAEPMSPTLDSRHSHSDEDEINWEDFKKVEFWHIGRGSNAHADALAALGSACSDLGGSRSIILGDIPTPSFEPGQEDVMWVAPTGPSWMDPLVAYLRDERLPADGKAAHRVRCQAASYFLSPAGQLYRRTHIGPDLRVLHEEEVPPVL
ncbi:hypothetical protein Vadar_015494 [Vaccinium darrowii]|uniref:Uncharacterized protein n=1 Tax=Vaccinium darrowii TaxID=229202 RepID=A0ACB7ZK39_9ERIC|nr:hypothetical protein Vadar_015494 [Vaccinium darrowii]